MSRASVRLGVTINLGDYQNVKVDVELEEDDPEEEMATIMYARVRNQALDALNDALEQLIAKLEDDRWIPKT